MAWQQLFLSPPSPVDADISSRWSCDGRKSALNLSSESAEWVISLFVFWLILAQGELEGIYYFSDLNYSNLHFCRNWKEILDKAIHGKLWGLGNITWKCRFEILSRYQRKREAGTKRGLLMALAIFNYINFPAMRTAARGNVKSFCNDACRLLVPMRSTRGFGQDGFCKDIITLNKGIYKYFHFWSKLDDMNERWNISI